MLVNLWASWCDPCRAEAPGLEASPRAASATSPSSGSTSRTTATTRVKFAREHDLTYPQLRSVGDDRSDAFGSTGVPENFLVDPAGHLALIWRGAVDEDFLDERVTPLIGGIGVRPAVAAIALALLARCRRRRLAATPQTELPDIEDEVMCPICGTLLELAESPQAERERVYISRLIAEGKTKAEIKDALVAQYGDRVLALPGRQRIRPLRLPGAGDRLPRRGGRPRDQRLALAGRSRPPGRTATALPTPRAARRANGSRPTSRATTSSEPARRRR